MHIAPVNQPHSCISSLGEEGRARSYLAFRLGGGPLGASDFVLHGHVVNEGVSLWWWEEGLRLLSKVKLDGAVLHQDVGEESAAGERFLGRPESDAERHAVLGEAHLHLVAAVKVLQGQNGRASILTLQFSLLIYFANNINDNYLRCSSR